MKNFLSKYFGLIGLAVYYVLAVIIRIPVALFMLVFIAVDLLVWNPITGNDSCPSWATNLYDWYCGK